MQINTRSWDNEALNDSDLPNKVYVGLDGCMPFGNRYEYSEDMPSRIHIGDILDGAYSNLNLIELFNSIPEIYAPINEIATRVSDIPFVLKRFKDDEIVWDNEKFNELFTNPNPLMNYKKMIWQSVVYEILLGASFQYVNKPALKTASFDTIQSWINIPTNTIKIDVDKSADPYTSTSIQEFISSIWEYRSNGQKRFFDLDNVIISLNPDVQHGNRVDKFRSQLCGADEAIKNLLPVYLARRTIYLKRGAMGFVVSSKSDDSGTVSLTPVEKREAQREVDSNYGINGQANTIGVVSQPVDFIKTSMSIQEMQPFDETEASASSIYAVLRVPKHLMPRRGNSTFNNAESDLKSFYSDVIIPFALRRAESFSNYFEIPGHYISVDTSEIDILQENRKEKAEVDLTNGEVYKNRFYNSVCSLNDWIAATDGFKGTDPIYDMKLIDMDEDQLERVKNILSSQNNTSNGNPTPENQGA